mgnify:CR=1 FL=1
MRANASPSHAFQVIKIGDSDTKTVAERLEWVRHYYGKSQKEFAASIDVLPSTYNNWLNGPHGLSLQGARQIKLVYDVSLDFLFFGETANLPENVRQAWKARPDG